MARKAQIFISPSFQPTPEQIAAAAERLCAALQITHNRAPHLFWRQEATSETEAAAEPEPELEKKAS